MYYTFQAILLYVVHQSLNYWQLVQSATDRNNNVSHSYLSGSMLSDVKMQFRCFILAHWQDLRESYTVFKGSQYSSYVDRSNVFFYPRWRRVT